MKKFPEADRNKVRGFIVEPRSYPVMPDTQAVEEAYLSKIAFLFNGGYALNQLEIIGTRTRPQHPKGKTDRFNEVAAMHYQAILTDGTFEITPIRYGYEKEEEPELFEKLTIRFTKCVIKEVGSRFYLVCDFEIL